MTFILKNVFSTFTNAIRSTFGCASKTPTATNLSFSVIPCRTKYTDWRMLRDVKRRKVVKEYAKLRLQINALRYNAILPKKLQEVAQKEIEALPTDSCVTKVHARCVLTSRARGRWRKYRMSRIIWRHLADYNQLSGVERAMWGWGYYNKVSVEKFPEGIQLYNIKDGLIKHK